MSSFQENNSSLEQMEADNPLAGPVELRCLGFSKKWNRNSSLHPFTQAVKQQYKVRLEQQFSSNDCSSAAFTRLWCASSRAWWRDPQSKPQDLTSIRSFRKGCRNGLRWGVILEGCSMATWGLISFTFESTQNWSRHWLWTGKWTMCTAFIF